MVCLHVLVCCFCVLFFFFFKQKTAYELRISDWSSDVCSSDLRWRGASDRSLVARSGAAHPAGGVGVYRRLCAGAGGAAGWSPRHHALALCAGLAGAVSDRKSVV